MGASRIMSSGVILSWSIAAVYTYGLNDDPTCRCAWVARLNFERSKVAAADHGFHVAGGIVDREQCALRAGILLERDLSGSVGRQRKHFDIDDVAAGENLVTRLVFGPGIVGAEVGSPSAFRTLRPRASRIPS